MDTPTDNLVLREDRNGIAMVTLNRPGARNALSRDLMTALQSVLDDIDADRSIAVVVLKGAGPGFCAGHDLKEMMADRRPETYAALFEQCSRLMLTVQRIRQPVIAAVHGVASAAGCQLVATCDLAVAADTARFATPGVNIGLFCSTPMVALSRAVGCKAAMRMLLTGEMVDAATAVTLGLVNEVVPEAKLDAAATGLAGTIAAKSPHVLAIGKEAFHRQIEMDVEAAYRYAAGVMTRNMAALDAEEGINAFIEKREPRWRGC